MNFKKELLDKIKSNSELVGILGLGYVGLPLAVTFSRNGINVLGFEKSDKKCDMVNTAENYIGDVKDQDLKEVVKRGLLKATNDFSRIKECDVL
ncbi:MAG TPA: UDP-N-acetyl-D-glucosamine dehydrogenase, partial [Spirochaetota bacterium]|nr:UDP-N-acetyl-D-glucosamine dehydrogenase [Spirochaetota bacterium]